MEKLPVKNIKEDIANIIRENITFSGQVGDYVIHGAIDKIIEYFSLDPVVGESPEKCTSQTCGDHTDHNVGEGRCESLKEGEEKKVCFDCDGEIDGKGECFCNREIVVKAKPTAEYHFKLVPMEPKEESTPDLEKQFELTQPYSAWINSDIYPDGKIHTREYVKWLESKIKELTPKQ